MFWSTALLALASVAAARKCRDITVDVSISAENFKYDLDIIETEDQATNFYLELTKQGANYIGEITTGVSNTAMFYLLQKLTVGWICRSTVSPAPTSSPRRTASPTTAPESTCRS